jgi:hypothetical protein
MIYNIPLTSIGENEEMRKRISYEGFNKTLTEDEFLYWAQSLREGDTIPSQKDLYFTPSVEYMEDNTEELIRFMQTIVLETQKKDIDYRTLKDTDLNEENEESNVKQIFTNPKTFQKDCQEYFSSHSLEEINKNKELNIPVKVGKYINADDEKILKIIGISKEKYAFSPTDVKEIYVVYLKTNKSVFRSFINSPSKK